MSRLGGLTVLAVAMTLVGWGLVAVREPEPTPVTPRYSKQLSVASDEGGNGAVSELAIFQQVAAASREAAFRAQAVAPPSAGTRSPVAPDSTGKGEEKRAGITVGLMTRAVADIAVLHGLTVDDIHEIYRRGEAEGWPRQ